MLRALEDSEPLPDQTIHTALRRGGRRPWSHLGATHLVLHVPRSLDHAQHLVAAEAAALGLTEVLSLGLTEGLTLRLTEVLSLGLTEVLSLRLTEVLPISLIEVPPLGLTEVLFSVSPRCYPIVLNSPAERRWHR